MIDIIKVSDLKNKRDSFIEKVNKTVGEGNWFWVFYIGKQMYSLQLGLQIYEDSFYHHLMKNFVSLKDLLKNNKNVFVHSYQDLESGLDYKTQKGKSDHYNDIAIRRCVARMGLKFNGNNNYCVSNTLFCETKVPFHLKHLTNNKDSFYSVKSWYNESRHIVVATEIHEQAKLFENILK
jgi:hypothetical protein